MARIKGAGAGARTGSSPTELISRQDAMAEGPLQFGRRVLARQYPDRPAAFGVVERNGLVALAHISPDGVEPYFDLPGGGIDPGETPEQAVVREFGEETGLVVSPLSVLVRADQFLIKRDGGPANNRCTLFEAELLGQDPTLKIEDDHALVWLDPTEAIRRLRLDSQAWAVAAWLRNRTSHLPSAS